MQEKEIRLDLGLITIQGPNIDVSQLKLKNFASPFFMLFVSVASLVFMLFVSVASLVFMLFVSKYSVGEMDQNRIEYKVRMTAKVTTQGPYLMVAKKMLNINNLGVTTKNITGPTIR